MILAFVVVVLTAYRYIRRLVFVFADTFRLSLLAGQRQDVMIPTGEMPGSGPEGLLS